MLLLKMLCVALFGAIFSPSFDSSQMFGFFPSFLYVYWFISTFGQRLK